MTRLQLKPNEVTIQIDVSDLKSIVIIGNCIPHRFRWPGGVARGILLTQCGPGQQGMPGCLEWQTYRSGHHAIYVHVCRRQTAMTLS